MNDMPDDVWVEMTDRGFGYARLHVECGGTHYLRADLLQSQPAVHINMLRGTIAKPTWAQIMHLYPEECADLASAARAEAMAEAIDKALDLVLECSVWSEPSGTQATDEWRRGVTDARRDIAAALRGKDAP